MVEKERRKLELDLKMTQETVAELERSKRELEAQISRKDGDIAAARTKLDDEQVGRSREGPDLNE